MPANSSENLVHIEETLKSSLSNKGSVDSQIVSSSKKILLTKIDFQPASKPYTLQRDSLRAKYISLNPAKVSSTPVENDGYSEQKMNGIEGSDECLPSPKVVLYPEEKIKLQWKRIQKIGSGLINMGNTCFLNSTLQCLTYTAPLVNYCLSGEHNQTCKQAGFCMMCELQRHIKRCFENSGCNIKPQAILQKLRMIAKHMHWGRQEDAHEFLRYVVDSMQRSTLNGYTKLDKYSKETTVVNQIFGGFLRSQVQCLKCKEKSNTYDPFMDLSLDIKTVPSLEKAFEKYVLPEKLDSDNAYMCNRCKQKVPALKRFSVHKVPNVLTISLKRFDFSKLVQGKIGRHIQFPEKLNMRPYMSAKQGEAVMYNLNAVLVHSGYTANSGHYYCYVRSSSGTWYCMNDANVQQVSASRVLGAEAYVLFYTKAIADQNPFKSSSAMMVSNHESKKKFKLVNGLSTGHSSTDTGIPIPRKLTPSTISVGPLPKPVKPSATPLPEKREKVAFGIGKPQMPTKPQGGGDEKPRIVMQIKNGKVTTFEKSPNGKSKIVNGDSDKKSKLVPYGDNSDSESDQENVNKKKSPSSNGKTDARHNILDSQKHTNDHHVVFDQKLNATTSVPGNSHLLEMSVRQKGENLGSPNRRIDGLNLMVNKSKESTPKQDKTKIFSDSSGILCISAHNGHGNGKVKATTTNWHVMNQDCAPSPSVGSSSSRESVNSTSGWQVKDKGEASTIHTCRLPDRQNPGWKVMDEDKVHVDVKAKQELVQNEKTEINPTEKPPKKDNAQIHMSAIHDNFHYSQDANDSETQPLISNVEKEGKSLFKKHKHKKHKKERKDVKYRELVNESTSSLEGFSVKKHKKKKHKHKRDRDSSEERKHKSHGEKHAKKHKRDYDEADEVDSAKKRKHDTYDEERDDYVWVEKTKDSLRQSKSDSSVHSWDHHIKDGYRKNRSSSGDHKSYSTWDGSRSSKVVEELEKQSCAAGYGSSVTSWEGGKSLLDQEIEAEKLQNKRHWHDEYDDDLDRGKTKKVKQQHTNHHFHSGYNPFQKYQDYRNHENHRWKGNSYNSGGSHSYNGYGNSHHHKDYHKDDYRNYHKFSKYSKY